MKRRGAGGADRFDETVSRSELLRAFGTLAVYAAPAVLLASQVGCDESTGGGSSDDTDCSFSSIESGSFSSMSCSSTTTSASSSSEDCVPGIDCAVPT